MNTKINLDVNQLYRELQQRGYPIKHEKCCGRTEYRKDYHNILRLLNKHGSFIIKKNNVVIALIDI